MKNINSQLSNVASLYKTTLKQLLSKDSAYIVAQDDPKAWSNGYIADMGGVTKAEVEAEATIMNIKNKISRFVIDPEKAPKIAQIVPTEAGEPVKDVNSDFSQTDLVKLSGDTISSWANGKYLSHFITNYPGCGFMLTGELRPIKVILDNEIIGLVMPVRIQE